MKYLLILLLAAPCLAADLRPLFTAIRQVESGGKPDGGRDAVGDGGRSLGPYQIQRKYHSDSGVPGPYARVRERAYAERVMRGYWQRYAPAALKAGRFETLARVHNGGPAGARVKATAKYWAKVKAAMKQQKGK
jgi:hypothetical protein